LFLKNSFIKHILKTKKQNCFKQAVSFFCLSANEIEWDSWICTKDTWLQRGTFWVQLSHHIEQDPFSILIAKPGLRYILGLFLVQKRGSRGRIYWALIVPFENFSLNLYISFKLSNFSGFNLKNYFSNRYLFRNLIFEPILQRHARVEIYCIPLFYISKYHYHT
jgi:hypothetical protein